MGDFKRHVCLPRLQALNHGFCGLFMNFSSVNTLMIRKDVCFADERLIRWEVQECVVPDVSAKAVEMEPVVLGNKPIGTML